MKRIDKRGMTLVEIMVVVMVIAIVGAIALPTFFRSRETSQRVLCITNRNAIEQSERRQMFKTNQGTPTFQALVDDGYLRSLELCPATGDYAWVETAEANPYYHSTVACSIHGTSKD